MITHPVNPVIAKKILEKLMASSTGIEKVCAKELGIDHKTFVVVIGSMGARDYISPVPPAETDISPFSNLRIKDDETEVEIMILDDGRKYLNEMQGKK